MRAPITGTAAGVPFTALPPADDGPAPLIVTWHMLDAPRSDAAFAAALPMTDLPAWRVHLGMPMCGARMVDGSTDAIVALVRTDALMSYLYPFVRQATEEFPAALASIRAQLPVDDGPIGVLGGSLGGAVALRILADTEIPVFAGAVVNGAIRMRSVVDLFPGDYPYEAESEKAVDSLDFVAKAGVIAGRAPLLVVSGELDHPALRADAVRLADALGEDAELLSIPGLAHPLADEPGIEPAPQLPLAREVDAGLTAWFRRHLADVRQLVRPCADQPKIMYPAADVPVLQLSLPTEDPDRPLARGERLRPLSEQGVLVVGSGHMTHGLPFLTRKMWPRNEVPGGRWPADIND